VTALLRNGCFALGCLALGLMGTGCGEQLTSNPAIGPVSNGSAPTPSTAAAPDAAPGLEAAAAPAPASAEKAAGKLERISYDAFLKRVAANPGKARYTVVDAWASWCGPCKENFPHLVEMNKKYGDRGLAVASISFDDPSNQKQVDEAESFLREKNADFTNYLLDEAEGVGFEKFGVNGIPAVFVYGPDGREIKRFTMDDPNNQFTYDEVEKYLAGLLDAKS
jgi:thiol-disulfide isomerase/thioredoxin